MGIGGISIWQLLIILVIVMVLFGTKKLRNIGSDLGGAIKSFRGAMRDGEKEAEADEQAKRLEEAEKSKAGQAELAVKDKNPWDEKKV